MGLQEPLALYKKIEDHRKRPLLAYVTSKREGVDAEMASDALPFLIEQLDLLPKDTKQLDFLIVGLGGDPMVAWRIMSLIRAREIGHVSVLIPQSAYSAATLLALGANKIIIHPNGHLGPVDMQIGTVSRGQRRWFSTQDITSFVDFVSENLSITDQQHLRRLFELTCEEVGTLEVGFTARSAKLAIALGERLLDLHMTGADNEAKRKAIVENLSGRFYSHAYPVSRGEAIKIACQLTKNQMVSWKS